MDGVRLRCRVHNQLEAERAFGAGFMEAKREEARQQREHTRAKTAVATAAAAAAPEPDSDHDVRPWLRALGYNTAEANRGAALCAHMMEATLEDRVKDALRGLASRCVQRVVPAPTAEAVHRT